MTSPHVPESHRAVILAFIVFAVITAIVFLPGFFRSEAVSGGREKGLFPRTSSQDPDLPNYDIRLDKKASNKIAALRGRARKNAATVADARDGFVKGENALKNRVQNVKVEYNEDLQIPEVIGPNDFGNLKIFVVFDLHILDAVLECVLALYKSVTSVSDCRGVLSRAAAEGGYFVRGFLIQPDVVVWQIGVLG